MELWEANRPATGCNSIERHGEGAAHESSGSSGICGRACLEGPGGLLQAAREARGDKLQVWLNGTLLWFEQGGSRVNQVEIPAAWESPLRIGENQGAAGVYFGADVNRFQLGGQRVRNLEVVRLEE